MLKHGTTALDSYEYGYDANGDRTNVVRLDGSQVGYGYDLMGQLTGALGYESDGTTFRGNENLGYQYDPAGNLAVRTNNTLIQGFEVDHANGLVNISRNNDLLTVAGSVNTKLNSFTVNGQAATVYNDLTFAVTNGVTVGEGLNVFTTVATSNSVAMTNESAAFLPSAVALTSDRNGNLTSDTLHGFTYDGANELTWITVTNVLQTQFVYDGLGRRRIRRDFTYVPGSGTYVLTNEVRYIYDGMTVVQERDSNNVPLVSYTRGVDQSGTTTGAGGIGGLLARTDGTGSAFYHADGNGNLTMLINSSGSPVARYLYDPYGNTLGMWGTLAGVNTYRYASKEMDLNSGQYYFGFRYYEPNLQRWLNRDPIQEAGGLNLYGYVGSNPINNSDLLGLQIYPYGPNPPSQWNWNNAQSPFPPSPPINPNVPQLSQQDPNSQPYVEPQQAAIDGLILGSGMDQFSPFAQNFAQDVQAPMYSAFLPLPGLKGSCPKAGSGLNFTDHAAQRAFERGFSPDRINQVINVGDSFDAIGRFGPQTRYTLGNNTVVVGQNGGPIISVFSDRTVNGVKGYWVPLQ